MVVLVGTGRSGHTVGPHAGKLLGFGDRLGRAHGRGVATDADRALNVRLRHFRIRYARGELRVRQREQSGWGGRWAWLRLQLLRSRLRTRPWAWLRLREIG